MQVPTVSSTTPAGHTICADSDLIRVVVRGELTVTDVAALTAAYEAGPYQYGYLLLDLTSATGSTTESRRMLAKWAERHSPKISSAGFGGNALVRTFMTLVNVATRLLSGKPSALEFFSTEQEARHFLAKERVRLQSLRSARFLSRPA